MTLSKDNFAEYPRQVRSRTEEPHTIYDLVTEVDHDAGRTSEGRAVYRSVPGGSLADPTGRIFIRFANGVDVADRESDIEKAGYKIAEKIDYAENAAWLVERSGSIGRSLSGIEKLERIKDVDNVEPQMLMKRASK